jgi:CRISPR-associated protein Cas5d
MRHPPVEVRVSGELACFTRPEMKVERVSYAVMTPSAARGVLEAIFWKPQFTWQVKEIWVLKRIQYFSMVRNEVNSRASERSARSWQQRGWGGYDAVADRAQRHTLGLVDVDYLIRAQVQLRHGGHDEETKYRAQFRRRVQRGQCFSRPYLGCREFAADFRDPDGTEQPIPQSEDLGLMLLDLTYAADGSGRGTPLFFPAWLERGVLQVPPLQTTGAA